MTPAEIIAKFLERLRADGGAWPPKSEKDAWEKVQRRRAFLNGDREKLRTIAGTPAKAGRRYRVDPLPGLIATTWADYLFGDDPLIRAGNDNDADRLTAMLEENVELVEDLHAAAELQGGEGEVWWRIFADPDLADAALLEWHSRDSVVPYWIGRRLAAVAFVTRLRAAGTQEQVVWRSLEIHTDGLVDTRLYRGTKTTIGAEMTLDQHPETADLADPLTGTAEWDHGLPMLAGRVRNPRGRDRRLGGSDLDPIEDQLLDLNEIANVGAQNMRLTARKRIVVPEAMLDPAESTAAASDLTDNGDGTMSRVQRTAPSFDASEDVFVATAYDAALGDEGGKATDLRVLEYSFDAAPLIAYKIDTVETALTRIGLTPQVVGTVAGDSGYAISGTALRLRMIPTTRAARGKGRTWDAALPSILSLMQQVDALPVEAGGFGGQWVEPDALPAVERGEGLPVDEIEAASVEQQLVTAGVRSRRTSIRAQHPNWTDAQVDDELAEIAKDRPGGSSGFGLA